MVKSAACSFRVCLVAFASVLSLTKKKPAVAGGGGRLTVLNTLRDHEVSLPRELRTLGVARVGPQLNVRQVLAAKCAERMDRMGWRGGQVPEYFWDNWLYRGTRSQML